MRTLLLALCATSLMFIGCKTADPNSVPDQLELIRTSKTLKEKQAAAEQLSKIATPAEAATIADAMKDLEPELKSALAITVGKLKSPAAVPGLVAALDVDATSGADPKSSAINGANKEIARALGNTGNAEAVPTLAKLLKKTKDNYVRLDTIDALGRLKDKAAVPALSDIATDERLEPFINKTAILALAQINDPEALPAYLKMLFAERQGVSFYTESSYGVFLLGDAAKDKILATLKGEDKEFTEWAKKRGILEVGILAKAAQIESDLQDPRAIDPLLKLLKYENPNKMYQLLVRMGAAESLGRMRAKQAVKPIGEMLVEDESNARAAYVRAIVQLGDAASLPKLTACAKKGSWSSREQCMNGLVMMGGAKEAKEFDGFIKAEPANFTTECENFVYGNVDCKKEKDAIVAKRVEKMQKYKTTIATVAACPDTACVQKLLDSPDMLLRERVGFELGRRGSVESLAPLMALVRREVKDESELNPRFSAICAIDWIVAAHPEAKASLKSDAEALSAQVEGESKKVLTQKIAEEVKRLAVKLNRG